jgi:hypothetical protein
MLRSCILAVAVTALAGHDSHSQTRSLVGDRVILNPGALVRVLGDTGRRVQGTVLTAFTKDSSTLRVCPTALLCAAIDSARVVSIPAREVRRLTVRGRPTSWWYGGAFLGGFAGALIRRPETADDGGPMLLGFFGGMLLGGWIGSRVTTWVPVFPCNPHNCAGGVYPDQRR